MKRVTLSLFYLLILFLPTQLGRHFFFDFASISGIRSDYLAPTVYLTDIIVVLLIIMSLRGVPIKSGRRGNLLIYLGSHSREIPRFARNDKKTTVLLSVICYMLFNSIIIATNKWIAIYKFVKILEFILLGITVYRIKPKLSAVINILSVGVFYSSVIAVWQFLLQKSTGIFWWLGERTFYAVTPGIAAFSHNGNLLLRPYATFPHPNVLGGFLAIVLPLMLYSFLGGFGQSWKRIWFLTVLILGIIVLILSFSRVAWICTFLGIVAVTAEVKFNLSGKLKNKIPWILTGIYLLIALSVVIPLLIPASSLNAQRNLWERVDLIQKASRMVSANPILGVGLNNSITQLRNYTSSYSGLYIFQPVHNVFLLVLSETGIIGLSVFLFFVAIVMSRFRKSFSILFYTFIQFIFLALFDHYLFTLQQGQLMFTVFTALSLTRKMA